MKKNKEKKKNYQKQGFSLCDSISVIHIPYDSTNQKAFDAYLKTAGKTDKLFGQSFSKGDKADGKYCPKQVGLAWNWTVKAKHKVEDVA